MLLGRGGGNYSCRALGVRMGAVFIFLYRWMSDRVYYVTELSICGEGLGEIYIHSA